MIIFERRGSALQITGTYTVKDIEAAARVHVRLRRSFANMGLLLITLALFVLGFAFFSSRPIESGWAVWVLVAALLYIVLFLSVGIPFNARRMYKQRKDLQRECTFSVSEAGLHFSTEGMAGTKPWTDYLSWKEGKGTILIYMADNLYQMIPKRFFTSDTDLQEFRQYLSQRVKSAAT
jgi:YcxB-like protein